MWSNHLWKNGISPTNPKWSESEPKKNQKTKNGQRETEIARAKPRPTRNNADKTQAKWNNTEKEQSRGPSQRTSQDTETKQKSNLTATAAQIGTKKDTKKQPRRTNYRWRNWTMLVNVEAERKNTNKMDPKPKPT